MTERLELGTLLRLLLGLRFRLFVRRLSGRGVLGAAAAWMLAAGLAAGLGWGSYLLFASVEAIRIHPVWSAFALSLFAFLVSLFWIIWPLVAAQVDEAYEMGRYFQFPVRPGRLYWLHSWVGLLEPSVLFFYPLLVGSAFGLAHSLQPGWPATVALMLAFVLMNVTAGRCLLNLFLNIMRSRRSGEILFGILLVFLTLAALIPPVDASWLFSRLGEGFGDSAEDLSLLANTAMALSGTPPGYLARGLAGAARGDWLLVAKSLSVMAACTLVAWFIGLRLLLRFYRGGRGLLGTGRAAAPRPGPGSRGWKLPACSHAMSAIFEKELRTLLANPKSRMLFAVPFYLLIILKIVGGPQIFSYLWGDAWAAVLLSMLGFYVLSVLSGQFFVNGFGYEGPAVRWPFWLPVPLSTWLAGRNLAHGLSACVQMLALTGMLFVLIPSASARLLDLPLAAFTFALLVMLAVGNLLSVRYPRRYHFSLSRRDRPAGQSFLWALAVLGACTAIVLAVLALGARRPELMHLGLASLPPAGALIYRALIPAASRAAAIRRESLIQAIER
ncbi:MAG: hypothetical protein JXR96_06315 [Deltaproteobacteria bacterium]|nr:hypothetical protein [Deltaproteobacteria bacterium]